MQVIIIRIKRIINLKTFKWIVKNTFFQIRKKVQSIQRVYSAKTGYRLNHYIPHGLNPQRSVYPLNFNNMLIGDEW